MGLWFTALHGAGWKDPDRPSSGYCGSGPPLVLLSPPFSSLSAPPFPMPSTEQSFTIASLKKKILQNTETIKDIKPAEGLGGYFRTCVF